MIFCSFQDGWLGVCIRREPGFDLAGRLLMKLKRNAGFTLIELLVVVVVMAILMGLVVGIAGVANRKSAEAQARADLQSIASALEEYRLLNGIYPPLTPGISALTNDLRIAAELREKVVVNDPWGRPYVYTNVTKYSYRLMSYGQRQDNPAGYIYSGSQ